ncbi:MAG: hypothetical protein PVG39_30110 [Desulfobacteraceae bacterium]|jgi:hypothetical protein
MNIKFKDINPGMYLAKVVTINEDKGPYGEFLRFNFTITEGDLKDWSFYGIVQPNAFKISKFYRWITTIIGGQPGEDFSVKDLIGKQCRIFLKKKVKGDKTYYSVADLM